MAAALGFRWEDAQTRLFARTKPGSYNSTALLAFLKKRKRFVGGQKVILLWDHWPAPRSTVRKEFLQAQRDWLQVEWLPG